MKCKTAFQFRDEDHVYYNEFCGICVIDNLPQNNGNVFMDNDFKSNNDNSNGVYCIYVNQEEQYDIILFGNGSNIYDDDDDVEFDKNFISSLQWLSLRIVNNNQYVSHVVEIDHYKTSQFQNTFIDQTFKHHNYSKFGYTKWKHYLILFGGSVDDATIDSIFYFDFIQMKWHKSVKVLWYNVFFICNCID